MRCLGSDQLQMGDARRTKDIIEQDMEPVGQMQRQASDLPCTFQMYESGVSWIGVLPA